jgi:hypothetical protein
MRKDPYTDETPQHGTDPNKNLQPRRRSEEASGGALNTSEEVAQLLRRMDKEKAAKTEHMDAKKAQS